jgi:XTP/dITP diphosphohydrolase
MPLVLATNNAHKLSEFRLILPTHQILAPRDLGLALTGTETGATFFENAHQKAQELRRCLVQSGQAADHLVVIADDSGLCVDALSGEPGIFSARWGGIGLSDVQRNQILLQHLGASTDRSAHYVCCLVALAGQDRWWAMQETWHGQIAETLSAGQTGFGYDPLFFLPEHRCTVADLTETQKMQESHRARAAKQLARWLISPTFEGIEP